MTDRSKSSGVDREGSTTRTTDAHPTYEPQTLARDATGKRSAIPAVGPQTAFTPAPPRIVGGIEWYVIPNNGDDGRDEEACQCARCGSSCAFADCWNCDDGYVERDIGDDAFEELIDVPCEFCEGKGGRWRCMSTPDWCESHPIAGREHIKSTAMSSEAWRDCL